MKTLQELIAEYSKGNITRREFWDRMQEVHLRLNEYRQLISGTNVAAIEIRPEALRVVTTEDISLIWKPEDIGNAPNALVNYGVYEAEESPYLLRAGEGAQVVFDIGANVGFYSLHWASRIAQGGQIHAFEPVPSTFAWLKRNVEINHLTEVVRTNNFGLSDEKKTLSIYLPAVSGCGAASIKNLHPEESSQVVEVDVRTLDDYVSEAGLSRIDLIKIDVEGAELFVIKGGFKTIAQTKPLIFMELLRKWSKPFGYHPNEVLALLGEIGYRCYTFEDNKVIPFDTMTEETVQTNFFFAHPDRHAEWLRSCNAV
jgi:FkbM family methyltransferase